MGAANLVNSNDHPVSHSTQSGFTLNKSKQITLTGGNCEQIKCDNFY